jgi:hypothetical protein
MAETAVLYTRELPGGGFVAIESLSGDDEPVHRARISVERRNEMDRRDGHERPIIAELEGASRAAVFDELYRIAVDNVAIARGIMRWQAARRRAKGGDGKR